MSAPQFATLPPPPGLRRRPDVALRPASSAQSRRMTSLPRSPPGPEAARPRHRPRHLRRLPGLRGQLQGMEHRRLSGAAHRPGPLRRRRRAAPGSTACTATRSARAAAGRTVHFPHSCLHCEDAGLRHGLPDRRLLQARRGRHRAGRRGQLHRLRAVRLGLPLRRARDRRRPGRDEEMHALHRPHLQREPARGSTASRPACGPARPAPAISATSAIPIRAVSQLVAERGGFDLMPELGYTPDQQIPAAAARAGPQPGYLRRCPPCSSRPRRRAGFLAWLDRVLVGIEPRRASRALDHLLHHGLRRRLWPAVPARPAGAGSGLLPADAWLRPRRAGAGAGADHAWPAVLDAASRPPASAPGGRVSHGARPGCRARALRRSPPTCRPWSSASAGCLRASADWLARRGCSPPLGAAATVWCTGMIYASLRRSGNGISR